MPIDRLDARILDILQNDCTLPHARIGEKVGLSGSAVRRRIAALRKSGVIAREIAILSDDAVKGGISLVVTMAFGQESPSVYAAFKKAMRADPAVLQCYSTSGQFDFVLIVTARSPEDYEEWGQAILGAHPAIKRFDSFVVWSTVKHTTKRAIAMEEPPLKPSRKRGAA
jgi:DNA-binding Lrp family transcriptional regulator